jgi:serine/threonine-protein phosphatase PP1 catalytic subunit
MPAAADTFRQAAKMNRQDAWRHGNVIHVRGDCEAVVGGDIHGLRSALAKVIRYADVAANPSRRLVLQEIIHGPPDAKGHDRSIDLLLRAARLKTSHRDRVFFVLSNHDVAQITGNQILKSGQEMCRAFADGVRFAFADEADDVLAAVEDFLRSLPLAVRFDNRVFVSHSAPSPERMELAGTEILSREATEADLKRGGPVYEWVWGRGHTPEQLAQLSDQIDAAVMVLGHQPVPEGIQAVGEKAVLLASDHARGRIAEFSTSAPLTAADVVAKARPITALGG